MALRCTDHLSQEHKIILRAVYVLKAMSDRAVDSQLANAEDVGRLLHFFQRFTDEHHQGKEEAVLFPELRHCEGALHHLIFEHNQERILVKTLQSNLDTSSPADFGGGGQRLAAILSTHIYKEEEILFDLVEKAISQEADVRLTRDMDGFDLSLRPQLYNELVRDVTALEWKYLGKAV